MTEQGTKVGRRLLVASLVAGVTLSVDDDVYLDGSGLGGRRECHRIEAAEQSRPSQDSAKAPHSSAQPAYV